VLRMCRTSTGPRLTEMFPGGLGHLHLVAFGLDDLALGKLEAFLAREPRNGVSCRL
jgi:hypothetical protein